MEVFMYYTGFWDVARNNAAREADRTEKELAAMKRRDV
jgi:hypothetical protein